MCFCSNYKRSSRTDTSCPSACISSIYRTYYTWKIAKSPDISYNVVPMGLWTFAELATGFIISCLPVIPKFFQHMWPKVSRALSIMSKSRDDSGSASAPAVPADELQRDRKLQLPSLKQTFTSVFSQTEKEDDQDAEYAILPEEMAAPRRDAGRQLSQMPAVRLATRRDDLENRNSRP